MRGGRLRGGGRGFLVEELSVQAAQFGPGVGAEAFGEYGADLVVRRQRLGRASGVPQGPDAQGLERFVERVGGAERGQLHRASSARPRRRSASSLARRAPSLRDSRREAGAARSGRSASGAPPQSARASSRTVTALTASPSSRARLPSPASRSNRCRSTASGAASR
ncbi:hypothetical protein SMICM304S_00002 [Streptomyces microflavus]